MFLNRSLSLSNAQTSALIELLLQNLPMGVCLADEQGKLAFANAGYIELFSPDADSLQDTFVSRVEEAQITQSIEQIAQQGFNQGSFLLRDEKIYERTALKVEPSQGETYLLIIWRDATDRAEHNQRGAEQLDLFKKLADILPIQLFFKDLTHKYVQVNESFRSFRGLNGDIEISGLSDRDLLSDECVGQVESEESRLFKTGEPIVNKLRQETWKTGQRVWYQYTKMPIYDSHGDITGLYGFSQDVTDQKRSEQLIWRQANYDHVTQLPNRRLFSDRWHSAWQSSLRDHKSIGLLLVDIDGFKLINETKGHSAGEAVLISVAERLRRCTRGKDTVARLSADEFGILATDIEQDSDLAVVISKVMKQFEESFFIDREELFLTASVGVSLAPDDGESIETLMMYADQALQQAKKLGGRTYSIFDSHMRETVSKQFSLANDLRYALKNNEFSLNFQPIIDLNTLKPVKAETLIRWHHPTHGWISPQEFIPVAEQTGQIIQIGDWVFREAISIISRMNQRLSIPINLSINVSPRQLQEGSFNALEWLDYLEKQSFDPKNLVIEITEGLFLDPEERVLKALDIFSKSGVKISLDDFGTGYASISFLENFEIDVLKLDQAFVRDSERSPKRKILSEAIINMAKALEFEIIAEGVETENQANWVRGAGCQFGQGYYFSRPLTQERLEDYLNLNS